MTKWNIVTVLQDIVLAIVINTSATLLGGAPLEFASWYPYTCAAFGTNVLMQLVLPVPAAGQACTGWLAGRAGRPFASIFVENLIFVTGISLTMAFLQAGVSGLFNAWIATYVQLVCIGYVTSICLYLFFSRKERRAQRASA